MNKHNTCFLCRFQMYNGIARILEEAGKDDSVTVTVFTGKVYCMYSL